MDYTIADVLEDEIRREEQAERKRKAKKLSYQANKSTRGESSYYEDLEC